MKNEKWTKMLLHRGTEFRKCYAFTVIGLFLGWLLHCVRIAAMVYCYISYRSDLAVTVFLLSVLSVGADVGLFFLFKSLFAQLCFLLGSYRIGESKLLFRFPLWGEMSCSPDEIDSAELCSVYCFRGGAEQKVFRILLKGHCCEDESGAIFQNTGIVQRKKALFFVDPLPIQEFLRLNGK